MIVGSEFPDKHGLKPTRPRGGEQMKCVVGQFGDIKHVASAVDSPPTIRHPNPEYLGVVFLHHIVGAFVGGGFRPHRFVNFKHYPTLSHRIQRKYNELAEEKTPFLIAC